MYHICGKEINTALHRASHKENPQSVGLYTFTDPDPLASAERIESCPRCGLAISILALTGTPLPEPYDSPTLALRGAESSLPSLIEEVTL